MRSATKTTGILLSAALVSGAAATPALAAQGPNNNGRTPSASCPQDGTGANAKKNTRKKQRKNAKKNAAKLAAKKSGTLTADQKADLKAMAEEEKLAHDVYVTLAASYPDVVQFTRIPNAESRHLAAIQRMLTKYGLKDPTKGMAVGKFKTDETQALFNKLVDSATTQQAALDVGVTIETQDIKDLKAAKVGLKAPDVRFVYNRLLQGSYNHLRAFGG